MNLAAKILIVIIIIFNSSIILSQEQINIITGYWPGYMPWEIAVEKGWFKEENIDINLIYATYSDFDSHLANNEVDAVLQSNFDFLYELRVNSNFKTILVLNYSSGYDQIISKTGIKSIKDLYKKNIAVEFGTDYHFFLNLALRSCGIEEKEVRLVDIRTEDAFSVMKNDEVDAVVCPEPISSSILKAMPNTKVIFNSSSFNGFVYNMLCVTKNSLKYKYETWIKIVNIWFKVIEYIKSNKDKALQIMAEKSNVSIKEFEKLLNGYKLLDLNQNQKLFQKGGTLNSIYGSTAIADIFMKKNKIYTFVEKFDLDSLFDSRIIKSLEFEK